MDKERRLVYSSADYCSPKEQLRVPRSRKKRRKINPNHSNQQLDKAARAYIHDPKLLPNHQIKCLIKTSRNLADKGSFLLQRLAEEMQRREIEGSFFKKRTNKEHFQNQIQYRIGSQKVDFYSDLSHLSIPDKHKRQNHTSISKRAKNLEVEVLDKTNMNLGHSLIPAMSDKHRSVDVVKQSLQNYTQRTQNFSEVEHRYRSAMGNPRQKPRQANTSRQKAKPRLDSQTSQQSLKSTTSQARYKNLTRNIKLFIVNEKNQMVSGILNDKGWKMTNLYSHKFTLKWTYNENYHDYEYLRNKNKGEKIPQAYYNHIKGNKLVKKDQFHKLTRQLASNNIKTSQFIPQTFLLQEEKSQFLTEYERKILMILIRKHFLYFQSKGLKMNTTRLEKIVSYTEALGQVRQHKSMLDQFTSTDQEIPGDICAQISLLFYLLVLGCQLWICQEGHDSDNFDKIYGKVCADQKIMALLISYSRVEQPLEQYALSKRSDLKNSKKGAVEKKYPEIQMKQGYIRITHSFMKPSLKLICAIASLHEYLQTKFGSYYSNGDLNLWILKPCSGSKGCGIQIVDKPERINQYLQNANQERILQKYIENVWILTPEMTANAQAIKKNALIGKKFDIRQWVLLTPKKSYIFSHFYIKICSKDYSLDSIADPQAHLSNFSINKDKFLQSQDSVCSEKNFKSILSAIGKGKEFTNLKHKIKEYLSKLVELAMEECDPIQGTFQIVGFDIILDNNLQPWIIECNMSPACSERAPWLRQMKKAMTQNTLQLVLENQTFEQVPQESEKEYKWQSLEIEKTKKPGGWQSGVKEKLEVIGSKIRTKKSIGKKFQKESLKSKPNSCLT